MVRKLLTLSIVMILLMFSGCQNNKNVVSDNSNVSEDESPINSLSDEKVIDLSKSVTKIEKLKDVPKEIYKGNIVLNKMQQDCTIALNSDYGLVVERVDSSNKNSTKQFPELKTKVYVINFKQNDKSLLTEYDYNYYDAASEFCIVNDNIYFIETHIDKTTGNSGEWAIKEYNLQTKKINTVDDGKFNDFNKYKYPDISFNDSASLFPRYLDVSNNKLVYNRIKDNEGNLTFEIILYDVVNKSMEIVAKGESYSENYLYDVAINDNRVVYTKYHQINDDKISPERDTTYKYCDVYLYDINTKKTSQISFKDFIVNLDIFGDYIAGVRYAPLSECKDYLKSAELVVYDINKKEWKSFVYNKSNLSNPLFYKNYLVFRDLATYDNIQIYDYINNKFIDFSKEEKLDNYEIIDVISDNILLMNNREPDGLYRFTLE